MMREFKAGNKMARIAGKLDKALQPKLESLIWQIPLLGFLVYFTWFYLVSGFWQLWFLYWYTILYSGSCDPS